jgi:uracil-DNA glycosylase family 4
MNTLGDEISSCARVGHPALAPVLGSGHPLADVMLVKYRAQASEIQEGVAFFGRSGAAVLKSVKRLGIDPLVIYGTNCVKCNDAEPDEAASACPLWLLREIAITEPKMIVAMGDEVVETLNELKIPLSQPIDAGREGEVQRLTPTIDALVVPDLDACLNDEESKRRFWQAFRALGPWYDALPPY